MFLYCYSFAVDRGAFEDFIDNYQVIATNDHQAWAEAARLATNNGGGTLYAAKLSCQAKVVVGVFRVNATLANDRLVGLSQMTQEEMLQAASID